MQRNYTFKIFLLPYLLFGCFLFNTIPVNANNSILRNAFVQQQLFTYPLASYKAGTLTVIKPIISVNGGRFSYKRISPGNGELVINNNSGKIDLGISDSGVYEITYKTSNSSSTVSITIL
jgi:hypothetical protein